MKICLAQSGPVPGAIAANINRHLQLVALAASQQADAIIFPELSITGYEPTLANELATTQNDDRFTAFQTFSDIHNITIAIGVPLKSANGITISLLIFQPGQERMVYSKQYLHPDEEPYFTPGVNNPGLLEGKIALAICYELSVPAHAEEACRNGADYYIASVAKSKAGIDKAAERLSQLAKDSGMTALLVNCTGTNDGMNCSGGSAAWNHKGELLGQLSESGEGILLLDTKSQHITTASLEASPLFLQSRNK